MELQALLVLCGVGVAGVAVLLLMGLFRASGTSYEEAIAQQRKATSELLALAENKSKNKKTNKKAYKKLAKKEKNKENATAATGSEPESEAPAESGMEDEPVTGKPHVEFCPPVVVEVPTDPPLNIKANENKEEVLSKKENKEIKSKAAKSIAKAASKVEVVKDEASRERRNSEETPKEQRKVKKIDKKAAEEPAPTVEEVVPPLNAPQPSELTTEKLLKQALATVPSGPAPSPPATKNKKKKAEPNVLSLMAGDSGGVSVSELVRVVKEASLSRTEIQILTDALLNKQHDPLPEHSEWTEGPNDPMQKLKKQLADKEKALADEVDASQALHAKLKELRGLLNAERVRAAAAARSGEQAAAAARAELHALQARLQRVLDDNHALAQEKLVLQAKLSEEGEAQAQRVQMEMHIQRLSESEAALVAQLTALQAELSARALEAGQARCEAAAARDSALLAQQHAADLAQQLQEANRVYGEVEQQRQSAARADQDLRQAQQRLAESQSEVQRLTARAQSAESTVDQLKGDFEKQKEELSKEITTLREQLALRESELAELKVMKAAPAQNGLPISESNEQQKAADLSKVEGVVEALRGELVAARASCAAQTEQLAQLRAQLDAYRSKNDELRTKNWKVMEALQSAERALQAQAARAMPAQGTHSQEAVTKAEESHYNEVINVLRAVCPAAAPSDVSGNAWVKTFADNIKNQLQKAESEKASIEKSLADKLLEKEKEKKQIETEMIRKLSEKDNERKKLESEFSKKLQETEVAKKQAQQASQGSAESRLTEMAAHNQQLQSLVDKYKRIIDDTEGVLSRLQQNVSAEEARWAQQLADKQAQLDDLQLRTVLQMQKKIDQLQADLQKAQKQGRSVTFAETERMTEEKLISSLSDKHDIDVHNGPLQASLGDK